MDSMTANLRLYLDLAEHYEQLGQQVMIERFLMLAAHTALQAGNPDEAERLRQRLLQKSRHSMLRPYRDFAEAAAASDIVVYLTDLEANYPPGLAAQLLETLKAAPVHPLEQTQPLNWKAEQGQTQKAGSLPLPIPMTAPFMDDFGPRGTPRRPNWKPAPLPPAQDSGDPEAVPVKPLAQPLPGRPASTKSEPVMPMRPTVAVPPMQRHHLEPVRPESDPQETSGGWFGVVLGVVALVAGVTLGVFTLARPFLPAEWLP